MSWITERLARRAGSDSSPESNDAALVEALRAGDESAFSALVERHQAAMLGVARLYVRSRAVAEEVVQETWLAVFEGIDRFEGRSSLKTWIFRILSNRAKTRGEREGRQVPFSQLVSAPGDDEPAVDPDRFAGPGRAQWGLPPHNWPHERVLQRETLEVFKSAIEQLPEAQREVIRLRDVEGWSAAEVASLLEISDGNQRVLLHRARSKVRAALEVYLDPELVGR